MKKIIYFFISFFFSVNIINAEYFVTDYRVDLTILENGNIEVIEAFKMDGVYNGFERNIKYKDNYNSYWGENIASIDKQLYNGSNVEINEVRAINFNNESTMTEFKENGDLFKKVSLANKGQHAVYTITKKDNGEIYKIYNPSLYNKDFYLSYTLENMVINHLDVAELSMFIFNDLEEIINNFELTIHIPNNEENLKVWVHQDSKIEIINNETIIIKKEQVKEKFDFRIIFDNDIVKTNKRTDATVLEKIIYIENNLTNDIEIDKEYNEKKQRAYELVQIAEKSLDKTAYLEAFEFVNTLKENDKLKIDLMIKLMNIEPKIERREVIVKVTLTSIIAFWLIGIIILFYYMYKIYNKKINKSNTNKNTIFDYYPVSIGYLNRKKVSNNDLISSILYLIDKKIITYEKIKNDYKLKLNTKKQLITSQERLMKFLFDDKFEIMLSSISKKSKNDYNNFLKSYSNWLNTAVFEAENEKFFENIFLIKIFGIIYCIIGFFGGTFLLSKDTYFSSFIMIIISIISILYFIFVYIRTDKGKEQYYNCLKFKENINKSSSISFKELIYCISLDLDNNFFENINVDNYDLYINVNNTINQSINLAYTTKKRIYDSSTEF